MSIEDGSVVRVVEVSEKDAHHGEPGIVGLVGTVGWFNQWLGENFGSFSLKHDGGSMFFYAAKVESVLDDDETTMKWGDDWAYPGDECETRLGSNWTHDDASGPYKLGVGDRITKCGPAWDDYNWHRDDRPPVGTVHGPSGWVRSYRYWAPRGDANFTPFWNPDTMVVHGGTTSSTKYDDPIGRATTITEAHAIWKAAQSDRFATADDFREAAKDAPDALCGPLDKVWTLDDNPPEGTVWGEWTRVGSCWEFRYAGDVNGMDTFTWGRYLMGPEGSDGPRRFADLGTCRTLPEADARVRAYLAEQEARAATESMNDLSARTTEALDAHALLAEQARPYRMEADGSIVPNGATDNITMQGSRHAAVSQEQEYGRTRRWSPAFPEPPDGDDSMFCVVRKGEHGEPMRALWNHEDEWLSTDHGHGIGRERWRDEGWQHYPVHHDLPAQSPAAALWAKLKGLSDDEAVAMLEGVFP